MDHSVKNSPVSLPVRTPHTSSLLLILTQHPPVLPAKKHIHLNLTNTPQSCPPRTTPTPITTKIPANPKPTNPICGGGRANFNLCKEGTTCIKDPNNPGCGPECDGLGICVPEKMCGGFAGFACDDERMVCVDDPRDDCDPKTGGADCAGLCMFPTK